MVKHTYRMVNRDDEVVWRVEEDACGAFGIEAVEFLSEPFDVCAAEAEAAPVDCNRALLCLCRVVFKDDNGHRNDFPNLTR